MSNLKQVAELQPGSIWSLALGRKVRALRAQAGLTVEGLAGRAGVSAGLVGQVERGVGNPSIGNVHKLATALGVSVYTLLEDPARQEGEQGPIAAVVRRDQRKTFAFPRENMVLELLTPDLQRSLELIRCVMPPGYDTGSAPYRHHGEECVHVLRGQIEVHVGTESHVLDPGDTITYDASLPHWWRNAGEEEGEAIGVTVPPSF
jgi:transcriptional regulator with XRE-family HTH domain